MSDKEDTSLIFRPSGKLAHIPPGAIAIIDSMVNDATDLIRTRDADRQEKTGSQSNTRWDPEVMTLGTELAAFYIEAGARNFGLYVKNVRKDLEECKEFIKPYLKPWYNAARHYPGLEQYRKEMTPYIEVVRLTDADIDTMLGDGEAAEAAERTSEEESL